MGWRHDFISKLRSDFRLPYVEMRLNAADNLTNVARNHVFVHDWVHECCNGGLD